MKTKLLILMFLVISPYLIFAQDKNTRSNKKHQKTIKTQKTLPPWAAAKNYNNDAHVYFQDYHTFYDPNRGGYVFMENGKWSFTPTVPPYMSKVDLSRARVQILKGLSLDLHPEQNYPSYIKLYPPKDVDGNDVLTPTPLPIEGAR